MVEKWTVIIIDLYFRCYLSSVYSVEKKVYSFYVKKEGKYVPFMGMTNFSLWLLQSLY